MRVEIRQGSKVTILDVSPKDMGQPLMKILQSNDIKIQADCGGTGFCGKCRVQFLQGQTLASEKERTMFSEKEINEGWRLACVSKIQEDAIIYVPNNQEDFIEVQANCTIDIKSHVKNISAQINDRYGIAVDIGTTTIAVSLVDIDTKKVIDTYTTVNHQRRWGADVISRIKAGTEGHLEEMTKSIREDLRKGIEKLALQHKISLSQMQKIAIAANTTMGHLFCGFPCESLGVAPYKPVDISTIRKKASDVFGWKECGAEVILLPGISTYVGADIVAGMYITGMYKSDAVSVLIDLGTNGEMVIGNRERFLVTSTAAGPAFEGGNISCGVASIPGAICSVAFDGADTRIETIGNEEPIGLCGTGVVETVYELNATDRMDETGLLEEDDFENGVCLTKNKDGYQITFSQEDIREIQLAKSAVRAGLECLFMKYGVTYEHISAVYIAGGFGYKINFAKAAGIGMLPKELLSKMKAVGNSSLGGAVAATLEESVFDKMEQIVKCSEEVSLATSKEFNDLYMEHMMF